MNPAVDRLARQGNNEYMSTVFEMIIAGEIPGRFVWADTVCVAIMTIEPVADGHVLVIPREPISKWTELEPEDLDHVMGVARTIALAQEIAFDVPRTTVIIAGFEVPHVHVHVIPATSEAQASLRGAHSAAPADLDRAARTLREELRAEGHSANVPVVAESPRLP